MQKSFYFLSPVEVVEVTSQNLEEVAEWCGGKVATTESRRVPGRMDSYVWVPTPKGTSISWAFPRMFVTKRLVRTIKDELRTTYSVFRRDYFEKNYFENPTQAVNETWEREAKFLKAQGVKEAQETPKPHPPKNKLAGTSAEQYMPKEQLEAVKAVTEATPAEIDEAVEGLREKGLIKEDGSVSDTGEDLLREIFSANTGIPVENLRGLTDDPGLVETLDAGAVTDDITQKAVHDESE